MRYYQVYRRLVALLPRKKYGQDDISRILARHRVIGGAVCLFDAKGVGPCLTVGQAQKHQPVGEDTFFRTASVAKMICAMMALRLAEEGKLALDEDAGAYLGVVLRNPGYPDRVITPRMLLSHTSSLIDALAFWQAAGDGTALDRLLAEPVFSPNCPGSVFAYSNFGAGVLGAVLEGASGKHLDVLFHEMFPGVEGSFYPQNLPDDCVLSDAGDVLRRRTEYNTAALRARKKAALTPDPMHHYALGHGNLCIRCGDLAAIGRMAMQGYEALREEHIPFGQRDPRITEGLGMFIIRDETINQNIVYGHQGLAYGAVNGVFFDPVKQKGFALLTGGASVARKYVLADLNRDLIRLLIGGTDA